MRVAILLSLLILANATSAHASGRCPKGYRWSAKKLRCHKYSGSTRRPPRTKKRAPITIGMVKIQPGTFMMGASGAKSYRRKEAPAHSVTISRPFMVQKTEVTRKLWKRVMKTEPYAATACKETCPASDVSWFDAVKFCNALSKLNRLKPCYQISGIDVTWDKKCTGYRLLTEAEWEYAARAGDKGDRPAKMDYFVWHESTSSVLRSRASLRPAGTLMPNKWGLYDMLGSLFEWVWDKYGAYPSVKTGTSLKDPTGPAKGSEYVFRGGSFMSPYFYIGYHVRGHYTPVHKYKSIGFRVAQTVHPAPKKKAKRSRKR